MTKDKTNIRQGKRPFLPPQGDDNSKHEATSCPTTTDSTKTASSTNAKSSFPVKQGEKSVPDGVGKHLESTLDGHNDRPSKKRKNKDKKLGRTDHTSSRASASSASTVPVFHEPREKDVLLGRGKQCQQHEGNQRMLMIIGKHHKAYISEKREKRKPMANSVLDEIFEGGVRFLKNTADEDEEDERWEEVGREVALDKVSHALRCKTRKYQRVEQEEQKEKEARRADNVPTFLSASGHLATLPGMANPFVVNSQNTNCSSSTTTRPRPVNPSDAMISNGDMLLGGLGRGGLGRSTQQGSQSPLYQNQAILHGDIMAFARELHSMNALANSQPLSSQVYDHGPFSRGAGALASAPIAQSVPYENPMLIQQLIMDEIRRRDRVTQS